jgi:DNA helicase HerA-like ATPase
MIPNISSEIVEKQKSLQPGTCVAFGKAFKVPMIVSLDKPNPEPSSSNADVVNLWRINNEK